MRRLREAVRLKRPERWQNNDWILHVDNARLHTAHVVLQFLAKHSTIQIPHPPYSPDLAPNDFFLYAKFKMKLKGRKFDNVDMIQAESKATLRNLSKSDFISCFDNWKKRWNRHGGGLQCEVVSHTASKIASHATSVGDVDIEKLLIRLKDREFVHSIYNKNNVVRMDIILAGYYEEETEHLLGLLMPEDKILLDKFFDIIIKHVPNMNSPNGRDLSRFKVALSS
ncbi:hypothetical protein LAZ67_7002975 [Cordylochernes scorpioides]|uniref:Transposase n=1 Tax=Cordylochernes scorpioides TaxID=51811 RepID=A0ABY6KNJ7_9ARAC|nr:hypothetical protein LAZ67_7002975 [Cordylochernes scorpioides]